MDTIGYDAFGGRKEVRRDRKILAGTQKNPKAEVQTIYYNDGSRTELIQDFVENRGEITEYDASGGMVSHTSGTFVDYEPSSDEEKELLERELLAYIEEKGKKKR